MNSLISKMHYLSSLTMQNELHIHSIKETWLTGCCSSSFVHLPGYEFYWGAALGVVRKHGMSCWYFRKYPFHASSLLTTSHWKSDWSIFANLIQMLTSEVRDSIQKYLGSGSRAHGMAEAPPTRLNDAFKGPEPP